MALCKFSSEFVLNNSTSIENVFINEFMPNAPESCVKVYLFGLFKCGNPDALDNNLQSFAQILNLSEEDIVSCFLYWQELGLLTLLNTNPLEVRYLPIKNGSVKLKHYNKDKYKNFNLQAQELLKRMITPLEYQEYYYLIESMHIEPDALIMIISYCIQLKGNNVGYNYILTIAKNWAYEGILTCEEVENRLQEQEKNSGDILLVLKQLGINRGASNEEYQTYLEWKNQLDFPFELIIFLAKRQGKNAGGFSKLNHTINKCYSLKLESTKEINDYFENEKSLFALAKQICKNLGLRYENLEIVVDTYISEWIKFGFDNLALNKISNYCFKTCIRTLEGMNSTVNKLFKLGLLTENDIDNYIAQLLHNDESIKNLLSKMAITRGVNSFDRTLYKTWKEDWKVSDQLIEYAASQCCDKYLPMQYLNKMLSHFYSLNITSVEQAQKCNFVDKQFTQSSKKPKATNYTQKELGSLFDNIEEVEV